jgi:hypothetical protein
MLVVRPLLAPLVSFELLVRYAVTLTGSVDAAHIVAWCVLLGGVACCEHREGEHQEEGYEYEDFRQ